VVEGKRALDPLNIVVRNSFLRTTKIVYSPEKMRVVCVAMILLSIARYTASQCASVNYTSYQTIPATAATGKRVGITIGGSRNWIVAGTIISSVEFYGRNSTSRLFTKRQTLSGTNPTPTHMYFTAMSTSGTCALGADQGGNAYAFYNSGATTPWAQTWSTTFAAADSNGLWLNDTRATIACPQCGTGGTVTYYSLNATCVPVALQTFTGSDTIATDHFGNRVTFQDNFMIVCSPIKTISGVSGAGKCYVFRWNSTAWTETQTLVADTPVQNTNFGITTSLDWPYLIVGNTGTVYVFKDVGNGTFVKLQTITYASSNFGNDVVVSNGTLLASVPQLTVAGVANSGAYVVYQLNATSYFDCPSLMQPASPVSGMQMGSNEPNAFYYRDTQLTGSSYVVMSAQFRTSNDGGLYISCLGDPTCCYNGSVDACGVCNGTNACVTTQSVTTQAVTTSPVTTQAVTTSPVTTGPVTTEAVTTSPVTTKAITTEGVTTGAVTTSPVTTQAVTTEAVTTQPVTTRPITTQGVSTGAVTTSPVTTSAVTTSPITTQGVSTGAVTTSPVTTSAITTSPITTQGVTTGGVTTTPVTTSAVTTQAITTEGVTTGAVTTSPVTTRAVTTAAITIASVTTESVSTQAVTTRDASTGVATTESIISTGAVSTEGATTHGTLPEVETHRATDLMLAVGVPIAAVVVIGLLAAYVVREKEMMRQHRRNAAKRRI
jgi:hypothetical protein